MQHPGSRTYLSSYHLQLPHVVYASIHAYVYLAYKLLSYNRIHANIDASIYTRMHRQKDTQTSNKCTDTSTHTHVCIHTMSYIHADTET